MAVARHSTIKDSIVGYQAKVETTLLTDSRVGHWSVDNGDDFAPAVGAAGSPFLYNIGINLSSVASGDTATAWAESPA